jgi:hypothetical protein
MSLDRTAARQDRGRLLSPQMAAESLGFAVQTLARWPVEGVGPDYLKIGSRVLYEQSSLDAFIDAHRRSSTSDAS